jgi:hypothetical protein
VFGALVVSVGLVVVVGARVVVVVPPGQLADDTELGAPATAGGTAGRGGIPPSAVVVENDQPSTVPVTGVREPPPTRL